MINYCFIWFSEEKTQKFKFLLKTACLSNSFLLVIFFTFFCLEIKNLKKRVSLKNINYDFYFIQENNRRKKNEKKNYWKFLFRLSRGKVTVWHSTTVLHFMPSDSNNRVIFDCQYVSLFVKKDQLVRVVFCIHLLSFNFFFFLVNFW